MNRRRFDNPVGMDMLITELRLFEETRAARDIFYLRMTRKVVGSVSRPLPLGWGGTGVSA